MNRIKVLLGLGLLAIAGVASADQRPPPGLREGLYFAPMFSYSTVDSNRQTEDGDGYSLAAGYRWDFASLEVRYESITLARNDQAEDAELSGAFVGVQLGLLQALRVVTNTYGVLNFGTQKRKNHPGFAEDGDTGVIEVGLGNLFPFELFGLGFAVRLEGLYRLDTQQPPRAAGEPRKFEDYLFHLGLQVPLSGRAKPTPPVEPEPVAVVPPALTDADGDGVIDELDQCPGTPSGSLINNVGCVPETAGPVTLETAKAGDTVALTGVTFEFNRAALTAGAQTILDGVAEKLQLRAELRVEVGGHTDSKGSDSYNQQLSEQRAESVMLYLIGRGVSAERLTAMGYGESQPVETNETEEGRELNRRVELKVLKNEG